jgi:hypothetical protein
LTVDNLFVSEASLPIDIIACDRPNRTKIAPMIHPIHDRAGKGKSLRYRLVRTEPNYEFRMSVDYFVPPGLAYLDINLEVGSGSKRERAEASASALELLFEVKWKSGRTPPLWGGQTTPRILAPLEQLLASR